MTSYDISEFSHLDLSEPIRSIHIAVLNYGGYVAIGVILAMWLMMR